MAGIFDEDVNDAPVTELRQQPEPPPPAVFDPTLRRVPVATPAAVTPQGNIFDEDVSGTPQPKPPPSLASVEDYRQRYGELRPADPSITERVIQGGAEALGGVSRALGGSPDPYHTRKISEGVVGLAGFTPMGSVLSAGDLGYHATRGKFGKAALDALGLIPGAMMVRRGIQAARGTLPMIRTAQTPTSTRDPTTGVLNDELQASARAAYGRVARAPLEGHPGVINDLTNRMRDILQQPGGGSFTPENAPGVHAVFDRWNAAFADGTRNVTPHDLDVLRGQLRAFDQGPDSAAGQRAAIILDRYLSNPPPGAFRVVPTNALPAPGYVAPTLDQVLGSVRRDLAAARGDYRSFKTAGTVAQEIDTAGTKAGRQHSGLNEGNLTRQRLDTLVTPDLYGNIKLFGASYPEQQAIRGVTQGDWLANKQRYVGNRLGGGGGIGGSAMGGLGFHTLNSLLGSWGVDPITATAAGVAAGAATPKIGEAFRQAGNERTVRAAREVVDQIRRNSPLYRAREAASPDIPDPFAMQRDAIAYSLLPQLKEKAQGIWDQAHVPYENREQQ